MKKQFSLQQMIKSYFTEYLPVQKGCSPLTISTYRDVIILLLKYFDKYKNINPSKLTVEDFTADNIIAFLDNLQKERKNSDRTRNARLATIHSFAKYLVFKQPILIGHLQGVLAIPNKRTKRHVLEYLTIEEINAILSVFDDKTWYGQRDSVLFSVMYNTGARVSEIIALTVGDVDLQTNGKIQLLGKGRKQRIIPLWASTIKVIKSWIETNQLSGTDPLFLSNRNKRMTRSAVAKRLTLAVKRAQKQCKTLVNRNITPHTLRHTTAMHLLQSGTDITVIAMWLGHESIETTHIYVTSDMKLKEAALKTLQEPEQKDYRFKADDTLMKFLENL
ncbi:MAG: tyrosine-type recombinase/integrase [Planctomycetia bacterium]|nr:tyrosine-type recombinase/integrase [Planctomycetia bacterium]